jgi:hypothetical protein
MVIRYPPFWVVWLVLPSLNCPRPSGSPLPDRGSGPSFCPLNARLSRFSGAASQASALVRVPVAHGDESAGGPAEEVADGAAAVETAVVAVAATEAAVVDAEAAGPVAGAVEVESAAVAVVVAVAVVAAAAAAAAAAVVAVVVAVVAVVAVAAAVEVLASAGVEIDVGETGFSARASAGDAGETAEARGDGHAVVEGTVAVPHGKYTRAFG